MRKAFIAFILLAAACAQQPPDKKLQHRFEIGTQLHQEGVNLTILDVGSGLWAVAVQDNSGLSANMGSVDVFYGAWVAGSRQQVLLHKHSSLPIVAGVMFMADDHFDIPLDRVKFIRVKLMTVIATVDLQ